MENEELNKKILGVWKDYYDELNLKHWPGLYPNFNGKTILFIGLNPSNDNTNHRLKSITDLKNEEKIEENIKKEFESLKNHNYFGKFRDIADRLFNNKFDHLDIFFYRKVKGNDFVKFIEKLEHRKFKEAQINISLNLGLIDKINPKIIFVANKNSSKEIKEIFKANLNLNDEKFFEERGFHLINIRGKRIPIFFSGMISSMRSIDEYSLERLLWHLKKAKDWIENL